VFAKLAVDSPSQPSYRHFLAITYSYTGNLQEAKGEPGNAGIPGKAVKQRSSFQLINSTIANELRILPAL
jgi:hypothetical protein